MLLTDDRRRWDERFRAGRHTSPTPSPWLTDLELPRRGRALDVAGGAGRHALWLAQRGLDTTLVDVSPVALGIAAERAEAAGVALTTVARDLTAEPLPEGPWDVIVTILYLERSLFPAYRAGLAPGGLWVLQQPTVTNLERHARPPAAFLLEPGEAARAAEGLDLEVVSLTEGWTDGGTHEARLVARRPG